MTSLPPPATNYFNEDSPEKKIYNIVEKFNENIPVPNDRNRLGFCLYKYYMGQGDSPEVLVKSTKIKVIGISHSELADKLKAELAKLV